MVNLIWSVRSAVRAVAGRRAWRRRVAGHAARALLAALIVITGPRLRADTLVSWDIPTGTTTTGAVVGSPANGLTVSAIGKGSLSSSSSSTGWRWAGLLNSSTVNPAAMTTQAFDWTFTTSPRTTASITQLFQSGTIGQVSPEGTGPPTSVELWAQTVNSGGTSAWSQVGTAFSTPTVGSSYSLNTAFVSSTSPYNVPAATTVNFKIVPLGATGGASSPKFKWISTSTSAADLSLIGTTGGGAWNMYWNGGSSGTWNTTSTDWLKDNTGSSTAFVAGDNAFFTGPAAITVDGAGITSGNITVSNASGTLLLQGGGLAAGVLTKTGAGTLELTGSNTFSSVSASSSVIRIGSNGALGGNTAILDNTQLTTTSSVTTVATPINVASGGATFNIDSATAFTGIVNTVAGAAANTSYTLTKTGAGALTIDKVLGTQMTKNSTGGAINLNVNDGSLILAGATQKNLGGTMTWDRNVSITGGTVMLHAGAVTGSGTVSIDGAATIQSRLSYGQSSIASRTVVNAPLTLNASASASLEMTGTMTGSAGITTSGNGTVRLKGVGTDGVSTLSGTLTVSSNAEAYTQALGNLAPAISGGVNLRFINVTDGTFAGPISGAGGVVVAGSAKTSLSGSNTYAGGTQLDGDVGITSVWNGSAGSLGSGTITAISSAGRIYLESGTAITFSQPVNTGATATTVLAFAGTGKTFNLTAPVAGSGQLKASTGAILDLTAQTALTNLNTGGVEIGNAYVRAASDANLGAGTVNFSATSDSSGFIAAATGTISRPVTIGSTGTNANVRAIFDTNGSNLTLTGGIGDKAGTALGQLVKQGAGTLRLLGSNVYTGTTTVSAGVLAVDGLLATSPVAVLAAATLAGSGTIGGATTVAGIVAPGAGIGTLTATNDLVWSGAASAGSTTDWLFELGAGGTSDLLSLTGGTSDFLKNATNGSVFRFDFGNSAEQGTFTLVTWGGVTDFTASDFSYTGLAGGNTATFSIVGNALNVTVVPEPAAIALACLGLAAVAVGRRSRSWRRA